MRHAERIDRAEEAAGRDWISTAPRPQDPVLSPVGRKQAITVGEKLQSYGITKILASPMIRCVITADLIAEQLELKENSICVESGLVEEAKSFRGKMLPDPRPNWNPLVLSTIELSNYSNKIELDYVSLHNVEHVYDETLPNTVREVHDTLNDRNEVTTDRCQTVLKKILTSESLSDEVVLCVAHGATVKAFSQALERGLPEEHKISGERTVSCFAEYRAVNPDDMLGSWKSVAREWNTGDVHGKDDLADRG